LIDKKKLIEEINIKLSPFKNMYPDWTQDIKDFIIKKVEQAQRENSER